MELFFLIQMSLSVIDIMQIIKLCSRLCSIDVQCMWRYSL